MNVLVLVYCISWTILVMVFLYSRFFGNKTPRKKASEEIEYLWLIILVLLAPLFVLLFSISFFIELFAKKDRLRLNRMQQEKPLEQECHQQQALQALETAQKIPMQAEFETKGTELKLLVARRKYDDIMTCMNKISLPLGYRLLVQLPNNIGIGSVSNLVVESPKRELEENIWSQINVEKSVFGAMQVFFLDRLWHYLPLWWHANYDRRYYVYSKKDLQSIGKGRTK